MKRSCSFLFNLVFAGLILVGCNTDNAINNPVTAGDKSNENNHLAKLDPQTMVELAMVRGATAKYHNLDKALSDGYVDINLPMPNMGEHYLKSILLDDTFDPERPELLVYAPDANGRLRLVAVEFAVPVALSPSAPAGFTGDDDVWSVFAGAPGPEDDLWTLHAWVWYHNPDGIFNPTNSRVN